MLLQRSHRSDDHVQLILTSLQKSLELAVVCVEISEHCASFLSICVARTCSITLYTPHSPLYHLPLHHLCMPQTQDLKLIQAHLTKIYSGHLTSSSTMSEYVPGLHSYHGHPPPPTPDTPSSYAPRQKTSSSCKQLRNAPRRQLIKPLSSRRLQG